MIHVATDWREQAARLVYSSLSTVHAVCIQAIHAVQNYARIERNAASCTAAKVLITIAPGWIELVCIEASLEVSSRIVVRQLSHRLVVVVNALLL